MENKTNQNQVTQEKEILLIHELVVKFIKLISKFASQYEPSIKEWPSYPNESDISSSENQLKYIKKLSITLKVVLRKAEKTNNINIKRIITFTIKLLEIPEIFNSLTKVNLLVNNGISLLQLISEKNKTEEDFKNVMIYYLTNVMRNFNYTYQNTFASLISIIANNLSVFNETAAFFDYEEFFLGEDKFLNEKVVPRIIEETQKLNKTIGEDNFASEFELDKINYENDLDLLYYMNVLYELKDLIKYKKTYDKEEYLKYKETIKNKLFEDRKQKEKENEELNKQKEELNK